MTPSKTHSQKTVPTTLFSFGLRVRAINSLLGESLNPICTASSKILVIIWIFFVKRFMHFLQGGSATLNPLHFPRIKVSMNSSLKIMFPPIEITQTEFPHKIVVWILKCWAKLLQAIPIDAAVLPFDRSCLEGLGYLAYETVGQLVDLALIIRHEESNTDPVLRQMVRFQSL